MCLQIRERDKFMVSMKDISLVCGVSVATVSKALNNHKDVSDKTKNYIKQVAKEMGYSPNSAAKALKTNKTYNIGVLFVDEAKSGLKHDYFAYVLDSFKATVEQRGYDITFINCCKTGANKMSYLEHSRYRGFDGVIIACVDFYDPEVIELINSSIPLVTIDHVFNNRICVMSDNIKGMGDLFTYAYNKGHRRIAYIHGADSAVTQRRLSSFYKTAEELGVDIGDEYIKVSAYRDSKTAYVKTHELLDLKEPPTCILYPDDYASLGGINAIKERGMNIPVDISIAGYDGINAVKYLTPQLTTICQDTLQIGIKAAEALIGLIEQPKSTLLNPIIVEGKLFEGKSIGRYKKI